MCCHWGMFILRQILLVSRWYSSIYKLFLLSESCICHDAVGQDSFSFRPFFLPLCCLGDIMCVTVYSLVAFPIHGLWLSLLYLVILLKISYIGVWHHYPMHPLPDLYFCRLLCMNLWSISNHFPWSRLDFVSCDLQFYCLIFTLLYLILRCFVFLLACLLWSSSPAAPLCLIILCIRDSPLSVFPYYLL